MLYASDLFRQLGHDKISVEENPDEIPELVAEMLCAHVQRRLRRNLSFGYQTREAILGRVRGRIDISYTERHQLLARGAVACRFEELTIDTPRNRVVREALEQMARVVQRGDLALRCRSLAKTLRQMGVNGPTPARLVHVFDSVGRHDLLDRQMMSAAELALNLALPTESAGLKHLSMPDREIVWLRNLYEKGIAGFYEVLLSAEGWKVQKGRSQGWLIGSKSAGIDELLPSMRTDIVLDHGSSGRRIVIDTKFNSIITEGWYKKETFRSGYVYQMYAYLRSQEGNGDRLSSSASGILLHPAVDAMVNEAAVIQGHEMRFATVDLAATAKLIRKQLLELVHPPLAQSA